MSASFSQSPQQRMERCDRAVGNKNAWRGLFESAYTFVLPGRNDLVFHSKGQDMASRLWDPTPVAAVQDFASTMQSTMMPPFTRWSALETVNDKFLGASVDQVNEVLQGINEVAFKKINNSNLYMATAEAFQDMAVSTGVLLIREGNSTEKPFTFFAVPFGSVSFEEGASGMLENFWRKVEVQVDQIETMWPGAELSARLKQNLKNDPSTKVKLMEGSICYPDNSEENRYCYYIQEEGSPIDLFKEFRNYSPFIGFRWGRFPGEIMGRGPVMDALPSIRILNKMVFDDLSNASINRTPPILVSGDFKNTYNQIMQPNALIRVSDVERPGIKQFPITNNFQFQQLSADGLRKNIGEMLFSQVLGDPENTDMTATEVAARQQQFMEKRAAQIGRISQELFIPLYDAIIKILERKNIITLDNLKVDGKTIGIRYTSPLGEIQNQKDIQNMISTIQTMAEILPQVPNAVLGMFDIAELPRWLGEKNGSQLDLIRTKEEIAQLLQNAQQQAQQAQQPPQQTIPGGSPGAGPSQPAPAPAPVTQQTQSPLGGLSGS